MLFVSAVRRGFVFHKFATRTVDNTVDLYAAKPDIRSEPRDAVHKRSLCCHAVSVRVRVSVCLSRSLVASKRIKLSSKFFHHR